jgi:branched-chain amino acid aminotransferase
MKIEVNHIAKSRLESINWEDLRFGEVFSDHMFVMDYHDGHWQNAKILPYGEMPLAPSLCALHYGQVVFEGLKAFVTGNNTINIFRPAKYHERMNQSCARLCIPTIEYSDFVEALLELIKIDRAWIPRKRGNSLYIRPFIFATENFLGVRVSKSYRFVIILSPVAAYYKEGLNPVRLMTSGEYVRATKGGLGAAKTPANYAASLLPAEKAKKSGFTQVIWLDALEHKYIEEVGTMNICFFLGDELVTPPLDGSILGGVTRDSVIHLTRDWGVKISERRISIDEIFSLSRKGKLKEVFGTGTAAVISPVGEIQHGEASIIINNQKIGAFSQRLYDELTGIQYGERTDKFGWCLKI